MLQCRAGCGSAAQNAGTVDTIFAATQVGVLLAVRLLQTRWRALAVGRTIDGVANRTGEGHRVCTKHHVKHCVIDSIDDLLASDEIDAVYLTTPHNTHIYLRKAPQAGKRSCARSPLRSAPLVLEAEERSSERCSARMPALFLHAALQELVRRVEARRCEIQPDSGEFWRYKESLTWRIASSIPNLRAADDGVYSLTLARLFLENQPHDVLSMMNRLLPALIRRTHFFRRSDGCLGVDLHSSSQNRL